MIVESLAICEYLEECFPESALMPQGAAKRARVRALVLAIACEIQPLNNLAVLNFLKSGLGADEAAVKAWYDNWIARGFVAVEHWLANDGQSGKYCFGDSPGMADCFLVPQVYNAERFGCDLEPYPRIREITANCRSHQAFVSAAPEAQPDAA